MYAALTQKQREKFEENLELDFAYVVRAGPASGSTSSGSATPSAPPSASSPSRSRSSRTSASPQRSSNFAQLLVASCSSPVRPDPASRRPSPAHDMANRAREHIMTVEDPIEFLHRHQSASSTSARWVRTRTRSPRRSSTCCGRTRTSSWSARCATSRRSRSRLTAAETGHLVFATLHTQDAAQTIDRIIDVFPPHQQQQVRVQLAGTLPGWSRSPRPTSDSMGGLSLQRCSSLPRQCAT